MHVICNNMAESRLEERVTDPKIRWYFTKNELMNSPSRADGVDFDKELSYRQLTASMIQEMGHRLKLHQVCTATAIVYMHRFFMVHSFRAFNRCNVASAALFLAAKVEEQPQKLEYVARVYYACINRDNPNIDPGSEEFTKLIEDITTHELLILETLGFDLSVQHAHPFVLTCMQRVRASRDLSQTAYFMVHNSLLLTTFCLEHRPTVVACCCIKLACVWKGIQIPPSQDQKNWWDNVDSQITEDLLHTLTKEFIDIYKRSPSKLQKKITEQMKLAQKQNKVKQEEAGSSSTSSSQGERPKQPHSSTSHENSHSSSSKQVRPPAPSPAPPPTQKAMNSTHHHHHHHHHHHQQRPHTDKPHPPGSHGQPQEGKPVKHHSSSLPGAGGVASRQQTHPHVSHQPHPHSSHHRSQVDGSSVMSKSHQLAPGGVKGVGHRVGGLGEVRSSSGKIKQEHHHSHPNHEGGVALSHAHTHLQQGKVSGGTKRLHSSSADMLDRKKVKLEHRTTGLAPLPPLPPHSSVANAPPLASFHSHSHNSFGSTLPPLPPPLPPEEAPPLPPAPPI